MDSARNKILGAFLIGAILVTAAWYVKNQKEATPIVDESENNITVVKDNAPRARITVTDSDNDGMPDWQEALQRTEPINLAEGDESYEPETTTDEFSIEFFQDMMLTQQYGEFGSTPEELASQATKQLSNMALDTLYSEADLTIDQNNTSLAVKNYGNKLAEIVLQNSVPIDALNEVQVLHQAYTLNDPNMLSELDVIADGYKDMIDRSLALTVPSEYTKEHLDLVNVYNAVYQDILGMKDGFTDPAMTVVRLKRYQEDAASLYVVSLNLQKKMLLAGITFTEEDPAYHFIVQ